MMLRDSVKILGVAVMTAALAACGGGGGGSAPASLAVTAATPVLINYSTPFTMDFSGTTVQDGTTVTVSKAFTSYSSNGTVTSGTGTVTLKPATVTVANGAATVWVKSNVFSDVTVTASAGGYAGSKTIRFIPQPDRVVVQVAINRAVKGLGEFNVALNNVSSSAVSRYVAYSCASAVTKAKLTPASATTVGSILLAQNAADFSAYYLNWAYGSTDLNTIALDPIMELEFRPRVTGGVGVPMLQVYNDGISLAFARYSGAAFTPVDVPNVTANDYKITVDYYRHGFKMVTK